MRFLKISIFVCVFLLSLLPVCVFAESEIQIKNSVPVLIIDEPGIQSEVSLDLFVEVVEVAMEKHIDRNVFDATKISLGVARGLGNVHTHMAVSPRMEE